MERTVEQLAAFLAAPGGPETPPGCETPAPARQDARGVPAGTEAAPAIVNCVACGRPGHTRLCADCLAAYQAAGIRYLLLKDGKVFAAYRSEHFATDARHWVRQTIRPWLRLAVVSVASLLEGEPDV